MFVQDITDEFESLIKNKNKLTEVQMKNYAMMLAKVPTTESLLVEKQKQRVVQRNIDRNFVTSAGFPVEIHFVGKLLARKKPKNEEVTEK